MRLYLRFFAQTVKNRRFSWQLLNEKYNLSLMRLDKTQELLMVIICRLVIMTCIEVCAIFSGIECQQEYIVDIQKYSSMQRTKQFYLHFFSKRKIESPVGIEIDFKTIASRPLSSQQPSPYLTKQKMRITNH